MMKKITLLLLLLLTVSFGYSQTTLATYSFDDASSITGWAGVADAAGADASGTNPLASIDWNATGNGTGALEISGVSDGGGKAFIFELLNTSFDYQGSGSINISFDAKFDGAYASAAFHLQTITSGPGQSNFFDQQANINDATWSTIAVDIDGISNANTDLKISFTIAAGAILNAGGTVLIDNIVITGTAATCDDLVQNGDETGVDCGGSCDPCGSTEPTSGAPNPPVRDAGDVVSFYGGNDNSYENIVGVNFIEFGGGGTIDGDVPLADSKIAIKYSNHSFSGIGQGSFNVSEMEMLHIDFYSPDDTNFRIKLESPGAGNVLELDAPFPPIAGEWNSYDIDLSLYPNVNLSELYFIVPVTNIPGAITLYLDNIYFYRTPVDPATDATLSVLEVDSGSIPGFSSSILDYDFPVASGTVTIPQITTATATQEGSGSSAVSITQASAIPGDATVVVTAPNGTDTATYTINIIEEGPAAAAPTPPARAAADVLSVFSPAYNDETNSGVSTFASATLENYTVDTADDTRLLTAGPGGGAQYGYFAGTDTGFDLTDFTTLHIDIWLDDAGDIGSVLTIQLQNFDSDTGAFQHNIYTNVEVNTLGAGAWIGGDIDLSSFTNIGAGTGNIQQVQLIAQGPAFGPIYFTNLYFHKNTTLSIKDYEIEGLMAYPNPSNSQWTISTRDQEIQAIEVYNVIGKRVLSLKPNALSVNVDASGLAPGVYISTITTEKGTSSRKLIKN